MIAITAATLFTPLERIEQPLLLVEGGAVVEITSRTKRETPAGSRTLDFPGGILAPGFIDMHIHGGGGHDVMEASTDAFPTVEGQLARHGVTSYFPTTITAPLDATLSALSRLADAIEGSGKNSTAGSASSGLRARPWGIHLEGPFISHLRRGVHPPQDLLQPSVPAFDRFWQAARGHIRVITIAPELPGAIEVISEATKRGVCVSLGHSDAELAVARAGVAAGARHATHTFNAMRPLGHRDPGILGEVLTNPQVRLRSSRMEFIVDPTVVQLFLEAKEPEASVLMTDATAATGMPDGRYRLGSTRSRSEGRHVPERRSPGRQRPDHGPSRPQRDEVRAMGFCSTPCVLATLNPARSDRPERRQATESGRVRRFGGIRLRTVK